MQINNGSWNFQGIYCRNTAANVKNDKKEKPDGKNGFLDLSGKQAARKAAAFALSNTLTGESLYVYRDPSALPGLYQVRGTDEDGRNLEETVDISKVDPENCTYLELAAYAAYAEDTSCKSADSMAEAVRGLFGAGGFHDRLDYAGKMTDELAKCGQSGQWDEYLKYQKAAEGFQGLFVREAAPEEETEQTGKEKETGRTLESGSEYDKKLPYFDMAENGVIQYNGVIFDCDEKRNTISLGDVSDRSKCLSIALSNGGRLVVNRENLGDLGKAIGMFTPEDATRIMEAITKDKMARQAETDIEENKGSVIQLGQKGK